MRASRLVALATLVCGCYAPVVSSGGYLCGSDGACPSGLACICGTCVTDPSAAACSLSVAIEPGGCPGQDLANVCVTEGQGFSVKLTAWADTARKVPSTYSGTASFDSTWGHAKATRPFTFTDGKASVEVALDRASPSHRAYLTAFAGTAAGASSTGIFVDPPRFTLEAQPVLAAPFGWATLDVGLPAIDRGPSGAYAMYYLGIGAPGVAIGRAVSVDDGATWTPSPAPLFTPDKGRQHFSPSVLRLSDSDVRLFFASAASAGTADLLLATSSDGGLTFGAPVTLTNPCPGCVGSIGFPWALRSPGGIGEWLLYFTGEFGGGRNVLPTVGVARTVDEGQSWTLDQVTTPHNGAALIADNAISARVLYDAATGIYRMWFAQAVGATPCNWVINYATSTDGELWTGTRADVPPLTIAAATWAGALKPAPGVGLLPGAIEPPDPLAPAPHYTLWFSTVARAPNGTDCLPVGVGRAMRP